MPTHIFELAVRALSPEQYNALLAVVENRAVLLKTGQHDKCLKLVSAFHKSVGRLDLSLAMIGYTTHEGHPVTSRSLDSIRRNR